MITEILKNKYQFKDYYLLNYTYTPYNVVKSRGDQPLQWLVILIYIIGAIRAF